MNRCFDPRHSSDIWKSISLEVASLDPGCQFLKAVVINDLKLDGLKQQNCILSQLWRLPSAQCASRSISPKTLWRILLCPSWACGCIPQSLSLYSSHTHHLLCVSLCLSDFLCGHPLLDLEPTLNPDCISRFSTNSICKVMFPNNGIL